MHSCTVSCLHYSNPRCQQETVATVLINSAYSYPVITERHDLDLFELPFRIRRDPYHPKDTMSTSIITRCPSTLLGKTYISAACNISFQDCSFSVSERLGCLGRWSSILASIYSFIERLSKRTSQSRSTLSTALHNDFASDVRDKLTYVSNTKYLLRFQKFFQS